MAVGAGGGWVGVHVCSWGRVGGGGGVVFGSGRQECRCLISLGVRGKCRRGNGGAGPYWGARLTVGVER